MQWKTRKTREETYLNYISFHAKFQCQKNPPPPPPAQSIRGNFVFQKKDKKKRIKRYLNERSVWAMGLRERYPKASKNKNKWREKKGGRAKEEEENEESEGLKVGFFLRQKGGGGYRGR